jgi:hypothetical protein
MKVRIGPYDFTLYALASDSPNYGEFHMDYGIGIHPDQTPTMMASTVLHEVLHGIHQTYKLPKRMTEEQTCRRLEGPLLAFVRDNPDLIEALRRAGDGVSIPLAQGVK